MNNKTIVYAVKHKEKKVITKSSSGGLFTALSDAYLQDCNAVASCIYNNDTDKVEFKIYEDYDTRNSARGSKYIQAFIGQGFKDVSNWLINNPTKKIMIVGTGCQMEGMRLFLEAKNQRERVLLVDLICHGATSPGLWEKYIESLGIKGHISYLSFKDKRNGWRNPTVFAEVNGEEIDINDYSEWFYGQWAIRESCYNCPFCKIERNTDITIGDYWGIENVMPDFADPMGVSLMLVHNEKGAGAFEAIRHAIDYRESNIKDCLQPRLSTPPNCPKDRKEFWQDINNIGIDYCSKKYKEQNSQRRNKKIMKSIMNRIKKLGSRDENGVFIKK